jgi:hypothetical protein
MTFKRTTPITALDLDPFDLPTIELYERNMIDELALRLVHGELPVCS